MNALAATTRTAAAHAPVAASVSYHDGAAGVAAGGVAHVVEVFHGVGYVDCRCLGCGGFGLDQIGSAEGAGRGEVADGAFDGNGGRGGCVESG